MTLPMNEPQEMVGVLTDKCGSPVWFPIGSGEVPVLTH